GRIPLVVRFRAGVAPHALPGVRIDDGSAKRLESGQTLVHASYAGNAARLSPRLGAGWHGVASARLPHAHDRHVDKDFVLHTLPVKVVRGTKTPPFADVWVQNLDNGRLFGSDVPVVRGKAKVSVPEGNYALLGTTFGAALAIESDVSVTADTTVTIDLASA